MRFAVRGILLVCLLSCLCGDLRAQQPHARSSEAPPGKSAKNNFLREQPWAPADVDASSPPVQPGTQCSLPDVLARTGKRAEELVTNLQQFTAVEHLEHLEIDKKGRERGKQLRSYNYLVVIEKLRHNQLAVEEYRNGVTMVDSFPANLATNGLPALALLFHPEYARDYQMKCEGLGSWQGRPAWQVRFQQRDDRDCRMRIYRVKGQAFPIPLKGRAWIDAESYQIVRLDTDLVMPIPAIPLLREHLEVAYQPVQFKKKTLQVWLPASADLYFDYRGHRYYRRHSFSDYLLFSVDVTQQIQAPGVSEPPK